MTSGSASLRAAAAAYTAPGGCSRSPRRKGGIAAQREGFSWGRFQTHASPLPTIGGSWRGRSPYRSPSGAALRPS